MTDELVAQDSNSAENDKTQNEAEGEDNLNEAMDQDVAALEG